MNTSSAPQQQVSEPWWKYGHMWMVVGGPLIVVVACIVTIVLTVLNPDPVYSDDSADEHNKAALTPAMQARNHAATGGAPKTPADPQSKNAP